MLPKQLRLSATKSHLVLRFGKRFSSSLFEIRLYEDVNTIGTQWFIQAPKKILPKANKRNRIKRLVSEVVRKTPHFKKSGMGMIKYAGKTPTLPSYKDVESEIVETLQKAGWI